MSKPEPSAPGSRAKAQTRGWTRFLTLVAGLTLLLTSVAGAFDSGRGQIVIDAGGIEIVTYTYHPATCDPRGLLIAFHGLNRRAERLRDSARANARSACLIVAAPLFDKDRFPNWRYHRAGVYRNDRVQPRSRWTGPLLQDYIDVLRERLGAVDTPVMLFGHSAGAQFLTRIAAFDPPDGVERIVIANPSLYVMPDLDEPAPNGFAGIFTDPEAHERLRHYLSLPITIYAGQQDTGTRHLVQNAPGMRLGSTRIERARNMFRLARDLAGEHDWPFGWRLVEVPGVGHSSRGMLTAPQFEQALGLALVSADGESGTLGSAASTTGPPELASAQDLP